MPRFACAGCSARGHHIPFPEPAFVHLDGEGVALLREDGIVARAFIPNEGVGAVEFVPLKKGPSGFERRVDDEAAFERDVGVLASPVHEKLALNLGYAIEGVVVHAFSKAAFVNIRGVKAGGGKNVRIHGRAKGEMAADADAHRAEFARAGRMRFQVVERGAGVVIVGFERLRGLEFIATIGPGAVVGQHGPGGFILVIDFRRSHDEAVPGKKRSRSPDGAGDLEYFGI